MARISLSNGLHLQGRRVPHGHTTTEEIASGPRTAPALSALSGYDPGLPAVIQHPGTE